MKGQPPTEPQTGTDVDLSVALWVVTILSPLERKGLHIRTVGLKIQVLTLVKPSCKNIRAYTESPWRPFVRFPVAIAIEGRHGGCVVVETDISPQDQTDSGSAQESYKK
jgi:hypothetical protein